MSADDERPIGFGRLRRKEDPRFIRGQGHYVDDVQLPWDAPRRGPAKPRGPCPDRLDRRVRRAHAPEGPRGDHRPGPRGPRARLDADDLGRLAGGARHRQGALPGSGGRVRGGGRPLLGSRRARADRRRVRAAARGGRPAPRPRSRRTADPRRQARTDRQSHLRLGVGRPGRDQPGVRAGRCRRRAGPRVPALAPGADGDLRRGGAIRPGVGQAHGVVHDAGAARPSHRVRASDRTARAQDSRGLAGRRRRVRQQGSGVSGLSCARSSPRSTPADRSSGWRTARRT